MDYDSVDYDSMDYDSVDYSEGNVEEVVVSLLRPHGTEWAVETEGFHIDYYNGAKRSLNFIWTFDNPVYFCAVVETTPTRDRKD